MPQGGNGGGPAKGVNKILGNWKDDVLIGTDGVDAIFGRGGNDILQGLGGGDTLDGGDGNDTASYAGSLAGVTVDLGAGTASGGDAEGDILISIENLTGSDHSDTLSGDGGANILDGGGGVDTVSYANSTAGVAVNLSTGTATGGYAQGDTLISIERLVGSAFADSLTGDGGNNVLIGGDGADWLNGGAGGDSLDGGAGVDTVSYAGSGGGVWVRLSDGTISGGDAEGDVLVSIENIEGSAHADTLIGSAGTNVLSGGDGDDVLLEGGGSFPSGDDTLVGGAGNDRLIDTNGDDFLDGGAGNDYLAGGSRGVDVMTGGAGTDVFSVALFVPDINGTPSTTTITDFEGGDDVIVLGGGAFDVLSQAWEQDGNVHIIYNPFSPEKELILLDTTIADIPDSTFIFSNPLVITGSEGADILIGGTTHRDAVFGFGGDDVIEAGDGDDYLSGGEGNDRLAGGTGNDQLIGGAGADRFVFHIADTVAGETPDGADVIDDFTDGVDGIIFDGPAFDVLAATEQVGDDVVISYQGGSTITIRDFLLSNFTEADFSFGLPNQIFGTEAGEFLIGSAGPDEIFGLGGNDTLAGLEADDLLAGGDGDDRLFGGTGADKLDGGNGVDTAAYHLGAAGVSVDLAAGIGAGGEAEGDTLSGVENVIGTDSADTLTGDGAANTLQGLDGDDVISGGDGDDALLGGAGMNTLSGGGGNDLLIGGVVMAGGDGDDLFFLDGDGTVSGDGGADVFGIRLATTAAPPLSTLDNLGNWTITDFEIGIDVIRFGWEPFAVLPLASQVGADVQIVYGVNSTLVLQNTDLGDLTEASFVFDATPVEDPGLL